MAIGRLYQKVYYYTEGLEYSTKGRLSTNVMPVRVQGLAHLVRSLSGKDFPPLIQELSIGRETHSPVEGALVSTLLNLAAPSLRLLDIDTISLGSPARIIPILPRLPLLRGLEVYQDDMETLGTSATETLNHLPALRHLSIYNIKSLMSERFGTLLQGAPSLKSLRMEIHDHADLPEQSLELLPVNLARFLQPMQTTLEELLLEYSGDTGLIRGSSVVNGCLSCNVGSFAEFTKLRRLALPIDWLLCNEDLVNCPRHDILKPIFPVECLPLSLEAVRLQLSHGWDYAQEFYGRCYGLFNKNNVISGDVRTPGLLVMLRMILDELRQHLPVLRQVLFFLDYRFPGDLDIFDELFLQHMPSRSELRAAGFDLDWTCHSGVEVTNDWLMDSRE